MKRVKRLYSDFRPEHYEVFLECFREESFFRGKVIITGRKTGRPSQRLTLHQKNLKIVKASLVKHDKSGDSEIKVSRINTQKSFDELRLHTKEQLFPGSYTVEVHFAGKITEPMHGIYPCDFKLDGQPKQLIATQFESHHAREAFPCIDEPEAKATFDLTLKTPADEAVVANTPVKSQKKQGDKIISSFETTPKMSTYLLAFAYGELGFKETKTENGVAVRVYATPDKVKLTKFALDAAVRCVDFFEDYFGVPYPLPKLDLIGLPDFSAAAMENWGLLTFRESYLFVDDKSSSIETKQFVAMVVAHEVSHQWFGNLVTMKWWNDLWLNESFANLMEYRAVDALFPQWDIWQDFVQREISSALARDSLPNVQPVQAEVNHPDELAAIFDPSIVYAKGGSLLNMVRWLIGEDSFRKGLKTYFTENEYGNTVAADLWRHLKKASHIDIEDIMGHWLKTPGFPVVEVDYLPGRKEFSASQRRLVISPKPPAESAVWQVPLAASLEADKNLLSSRAANFKLSKPDDYPLTLNHDGHSYLVAKYLNQKHFDQILTAVEKAILSPIDRLLLVQNYLLLERAGQVSTLENVQLLKAYKNEREEAVWGMLTGIIGNVRALIGKDRALEERLNSFVRPLAAPLVKELGWCGTKNEPAQTQKFRALALGLAASAESEEVIKEGLELFKGFERPADLAPDIRAVVYYIAIRHGSPTDFNQLLKLYKSLTNADEQDEVAAELTSTRDPKRISQLLDMITGPDVRLQDVPAWFARLLRNRWATDQTWDWLQNNWKWVEEKYASDKSYDRFPRYAGAFFSYPQQLKEYKAFFEPRQNTALELPIKLGIEEITGRITWRERNEQTINNWLSSLDFD